jgi:cobalamin biosynthesis protein CobD
MVYPVARLLLHSLDSMPSKQTLALASVILTIAVLLDQWLGEPRRWHPLVGFGHLADQVERRLYGPPDLHPLLRRWRGIAAVVMLVIPPVLLAKLLTLGGPFAVTVEIVLLYLTLGAASLAQYAQAVAEALADGNMEGARKRVSYMVSRDTADMDAQAVARATVESVLENGCDAVFGALFWYLLVGAPGALAYRLINTLDAMWGYRNTRYHAFGWAAARLDDVFNWLPARLTALSYLLLGQRRRAWRCWRVQAAAWESPNAGPVMAAGAGALGLRLGGTASYHGQLRHRPVLGEGVPPAREDIARAVQLVHKGIMLWVVTALIAGVVLA